MIPFFNYITSFVCQSQAMADEMNSQSREIKVRIWDKINKRWAGHHDFRGELHCERNGNIQWIWNLTNKEMNKYFETCQYTSLKDKNGKERFEGDIITLKASIGKRITLPIKYTKIICIIRKYETEEFNGFGFEYNDKRLLSFIDAKTIEVIGNIYENPELLKDNK